MVPEVLYRRYVAEELVGDLQKVLVNKLYGRIDLHNSLDVIGVRRPVLGALTTNAVVQRMRNERPS
jgi:hypothetical protein